MKTEALTHLGPCLYSISKTFSVDSLVDGILNLQNRDPLTSVIASPTTKPDPDINDTPLIPELEPSIILF